MSLIKILLVEDDEDDFELFKEILDDIKSYEFEIRWAKNYKEALKTITENGNYDIYIVDYLLGAYSGLNVCQHIKNHNETAPIILLTGKGDTEIDKKASNMGINDFIIKGDISAVDLERSIRYSIKQAEILAELKISESKYKAVLKQSKDIIFIADLNFNIISISDSIATTTGFNLEQVKKISILDLVLEPEKKLLIKQAVESNKNLTNFNFTLFCNNNITKNALLNCNFQQGGQLHSEFIHGVIIDKTEELKAERTRLVYEKLDATARFMRTLAHEVRNPLSNISLALEGIEAEQEEKENSLYFSIIKRNAFRIDDIITKVLNCSQIEHKKLIESDIVELTKQIIKTIEDKINLKSIELILQFPNHPILVNINEEQFTLAISNLLVNAVEALENTPNGKIEIIIKDDIYIIKDNGPGISKADQSLIFEPYFTKKITGIGLGLSSCINILKLHNITLMLNSELGKGAEFVLKLPVNS